MLLRQLSQNTAQASSLKSPTYMLYIVHSIKAVYSRFFLCMEAFVFVLQESWRQQHYEPRTSSQTERGAV